MPNWCSNSITITGDKDKLKEINDLLESIEEKSKSNVFLTLVGRIPDMTEEEYQNQGWYSGNSSYWGTKWDVSHEDCCVYVTEDEIRLQPDTAWAPPVGFCRLLAEKFGVEVSVEFSEGGCDFAGKVSYDNEGMVVEEEDYTYREGQYILDNESFWYSVDDDLDYFISDGDDKTFEQFMEDTYPFVDEEDNEEIKSIYKLKLEENGKSK